MKLCNNKELETITGGQVDISRTEYNKNDDIARISMHRTINDMAGSGIFIVAGAIAWSMYNTKEEGHTKSDGDEAVITCKSIGEGFLYGLVGTLVIGIGVSVATLIGDKILSSKGSENSFEDSISDAVSAFLGTTIATIVIGVVTGYVGGSLVAAEKRPTLETMCKYSGAVIAAGTLISFFGNITSHYITGKENKE